HGLAPPHELRAVPAARGGNRGRDPGLPSEPGMARPGSRRAPAPGRPWLRSHRGLRLRLHSLADPPLDRAHDGLADGGHADVLHSDTATAGKVFTLTSGLFLGRAVLPMAWGIAALAYFGGTGRASPDDVLGDN